MAEDKTDGDVSLSPWTDLAKSLDYEQVLEFFETKSGYACFVCGDIKKTIISNRDTPPAYASITNLMLLPVVPGVKKVVPSILLQCNTCGRIDFFSVSFISAWLKQRNHEEVLDAQSESQ